MLALIDFIPAYCPNCGRELGISEDRHSLYDWQHKNSFMCECGLRYIKADTHNMIDAADSSNSDTQYIKPA